MLSVHGTPEKFENATIIGDILDLYLRKTQAGNHMIFVVSSSSESSYMSIFNR